MGEWKTQTLDRIADFRNGKSRPMSVGEIPVYGGNGILGYADKSNSNGEVVVIGRVGAYCGSVYYEDKPIWISDNAMFALPKGGNSKFLYYFLKNLDLNNLAEGSSHPLLTQTLLNSIETKYPDLSEQKAIAEVLSSLDDKIDLLHRQNKTLESLAQTLFRQWFIEEANDGWEERGLDGIAEFVNGLACQKYPRRVGEIGLPVIKIRELRTGITDSSDIATAEVPEKYLVNDGDILFSWSGSLEVVIWSGGKGVLNQHLFKVTSDEFPQWFYYFWIKQHLIDFRGVAEDKATTMGHIQRHHLTNALVLVPSTDELRMFNTTLDPMFRKIKANQSQIIALTRSRDALLPKLMSGDISLK